MVITVLGSDENTVLFIAILRGARAIFRSATMIVVTVTRLMSVETLRQRYRMMLVVRAAPQHSVDNHRGCDRKCHNQLHTAIVARDRGTVNFNPQTLADHQFEHVGSKRFPGF
jgi:hypothetical protein